LAAWLEVHRKAGPTQPGPSIVTTGRPFLRRAGAPKLERRRPLCAASCPPPAIALPFGGAALQAGGRCPNSAIGMPDVPQAIEAAQPVTGLRPRDVAPAALLCGDPARVDRIARRWTAARVVAAVREFRVVTGRHEGLALTAASTGIGAPGTAVLVEE